MTSIDITIVHCSSAEEFAGKVVSYFERSVIEKNNNVYSCSLADDITICSAASREDLIQDMINTFKANSKIFFSSKSKS